MRLLLIARFQLKHVAFGRVVAGRGPVRCICQMCTSMHHHGRTKAAMLRILSAPHAFESDG